jgi:hypothetical protein
MIPLRSALFISLFLLCVVVSTAAQGEFQRFELGPQVTQVYLETDVIGSVSYQPAFGGIFSAAIKRNLAFDSALSLTPKVPDVRTVFAGGRMTQAFFGIRLGFWKGRVGLFAKARLGLASFGSVIRAFTPPPSFSFQFGRLTEPSVDVGGVVIVAISRRLAVRYDVGDTLIFYPGSVFSAGQSSTPSQTTNNFQFASSFLFRF